MTAKEKADCIYAISHAKYIFILPIAIIGLLSHFSRSMRWKLLMEPLGYSPAIKNVFAATMVGYLVNSAIPRLGEVIKCSVLARYEKLQTEKLLGTIVIERLFDILCFFIFACCTFLFQVERVNLFFQNEVLQPGYDTDYSIFLKIGVIILLLLVTLVIVRRVFLRNPQNPFYIRVKDFISRFTEGLKSILKLRSKTAFLAHTVFIWSMYLLQIYLGFYALEGTAGLGFAAACSVLTFASVAMVLTPGGLGSFPLFVMKVLLLYGISAGTGQAFGWIIWSISTGIIILGGSIALILLPIMNKQHETNRIRRG